MRTWIKTTYGKSCTKCTQPITIEYFINFNLARQIPSRFELKT